MDNKKPESYEETHKKLAEALQEACSTKEFGEYKIPDIDLSFLEDDCIFDESEEVPVPEKNEKKKHFHFSRFTKVAAIIVILLLSINILMLATDSTDSYGKKGLLHRISQSITGIITDGDKPATDDEIIKEYTAQSETELGDIIKAFPELYIPNYIPEGFYLDKLSVKFYLSGDCRAKYIYVRNTERLLIGISYTVDSMKKVYSAEVEEVLELSDRIIYLYRDVNNSSYVADIYLEDCFIDVSGINDRDEIIYISKNIRQIKETH